MKWFKRLLLAAAVAIPALAIAAYVAVRMAFPPEKVAELVRVHGSEILGRPVSVEGVGVGVFPRLKLGVRGVTLANDSGFSAEPALSLKRLDLAVSWLSLLRLSPTIYEVRLVEPDILFEVDAAGRNNLEGLGAADTAAADTASALPELPASVSLESFVIESGRVRYRDLQAGTAVTLGRIDQRASLSLDAKLADVRTAGTLTLSEIAISDQASGIRKGGVRITVRHDLRLDLPGDSLSIRAVEVSLQDVKARVEGSLKGFSTPAPFADVHVSAPSVSLAGLLREVPPELSPEIRKLSARGTASLDLRVQGVLDTNPQRALRAVRADVTVRDGAFSHADVSQGVEGFTLDLQVRGDSVRLERLDFRSGPSPFHAEALVTGVLDPAPHLRLLRAEGDLDLGGLVGVAHALGLLDPAIQVKGSQSLELEASGPVDAAHPERLSVNGRAELRGVEARLPDLPVIRVRGLTEFSNARVRQRLETSIGKSDALVSTEVTGWLALVLPEQDGGRRPYAKVEVRSSLIDLDELLPKSGADAPDTAAPLTEYPEWPPVDADVTVSLARTRLMNLDMTDFTLKSAVRRQSAVTDLKGTLYSGNFSSNLSVVPHGPRDWGIGIKLDVNRVEANDFVSRLNDRVPLKNKLLRSLAGADSSVFGKFDLHLDLKTRGLPDAYADNLSGPIRFAVTDGKLVGVAWSKSLSGALAKTHSSLGYESLGFSALRGDLEAKDGKLIVNDLSFDSPKAGAGRATGTVGFDNTLDLELTQALPPSASGLVAGAGGALLGQLAKLAPGAGLSGASLFPLDASGRALLYYHVGGEVASPTFTLDLRRMASEGSGNAAKKSLENAARARAAEEAAKLDAAARAKLDAEKARLQAAAEAEKKKLQEKAAEEARKQGKKLLDKLGK